MENIETLHVISEPLFLYFHMSMSCSTFCCSGLYIASAIFSILCLTDWRIFESSLKTLHNLKAIKLVDAPVDAVLAVLSRKFEEVELDFMVC